MPLLNIFDRIDNSLSRVKHITAFVEEETLKLVLVCMIVGFISASFVVLFMILLRRTILINQNIARKKLVEKYGNFLAESLSYFYDNDKIFEIKSFSVKLNKKDQTRSFNRKVLLDQILLMKKHVGGEESKMLFDLYEKLGYSKTAVKKLKSWHWNTRFEALQELILMESKSAETLFQKMTLDKNSFVRIAAIKALILKGGYLQNGQAAWQPSFIRYSYALSAWEQSQIFDALSRYQNIQLPNFAPLLYSFNPTVVLFGLKMIKYFHCMEAIPQVIPFLKSENSIIVKAVEDVLLQFDFKVDETIEKQETHILKDALLLHKSPQLLDIHTLKVVKEDLVSLLSFDELKELMSENKTHDIYKSNNLPKIKSKKSNPSMTGGGISNKKKLKLRLNRGIHLTRSMKNQKNTGGSYQTSPAPILPNNSPLYWLEKTNLKTDVPKGINYTHPQVTIFDKQPHEIQTMVFKNTKTPSLKVEISRWNNLLLLGKKIYTLKDKPLNIIAIRFSGLETGTLLPKHSTFLCVFGQNKSKVSLEKIYQDNPSSFGIETPKKTILSNDLTHESTRSVTH